MPWLLLCDRWRFNRQGLHQMPLRSVRDQLGALFEPRHEQNLFAILSFNTKRTAKFELNISSIVFCCNMQVWTVEFDRFRHLW
jgi:hypothetical protein